MGYHYYGMDYKIPVEVYSINYVGSGINQGHVMNSLQLEVRTLKN